METSNTVPTPGEAASALRDAEAAGSALAGGLRLPSYFYSSIGTVISLQIGTAAVGVAAQNVRGLAVAVAGSLLMLCVAGLQVARFRSLNGVLVRAFESRVVGGTASMASTAYVVAFGGAVWAAFAHVWWMVVGLSVFGGVGYAVGGRRWWQAYKFDPAGNSRGDSVVLIAVIACVAVGGIAVLVFNS